MAHATPPALNANDRVILVEDAELNCIHNAPSQPAVNIFLPWCLLEVGLLLGEVEGVDTAVQVGVAGGRSIAGDHDNGAHRAVFGDEAGRVTAVNC